MKDLRYNRYNNSLKLHFNINNYDVSEQTRELVTDDNNYKNFISNPKEFYNIPGAAEQVEYIKKHEMYKLPNLIYNSNFKKEIADSKYYLATQSLIDSGYLPNFYNFGKKDIPDVGEEGLAGVMAAIVAGVIFAVEVAVGEGIAVGVRVYLWTEVKTKSESTRILNKLMKMYKIPKINKSMGSIIAYIESEFGENKAHEFDRYICNEILETYKKAKLYRDNFDCNFAQNILLKDKLLSL